MTLSKGIYKNQEKKDLFLHFFLSQLPTRKYALATSRSQGQMRWSSPARLKAIPWQKCLGQTSVFLPSPAIPRPLKASTRLPVFCA